MESELSLGPGVTSPEQTRITIDRFIWPHGNYSEDSGFSLTHTHTHRHTQTHTRSSALAPKYANNN